MMFIKNLLLPLFILFVCSLSPHTNAYGQSRKDFPHGSVELISDYDSIVPGLPFSLGIEFKLEEGWHVYWKNPGDTGLPTIIKWNLPVGFKAADISWPSPRRFQYGEFINFGYDQSVLLSSTLQSPSELGKDTVLSFSADLTWVLCKDECNPGSAHLTLDMPKSLNAPEHSMMAQIFSRAHSNLPANTVKAQFEEQEEALIFRFAKIPLVTKGALTVSFFPESKDVVNSHSEPEASFDDNGGLVLVLKKGSEFKRLGASELKGVLVLKDSVHATTQTFSFEANRALSKLQAERGSMDFSTLLWTIFSAFLGGLILNLMPCVFPVISMKILGFVHSAGSRKAPLHGLAFCAGVLLSFWVLAAALLIVRAGGAGVGWGFQFQSPRFVAFMGYLVFAIGLNFAGVFEIGGKLQTAAGKLDCAPGLGGSFLSGMLATLLATPCTAPFMATAIGAALALPTIEAFAIFTAVGFGMSAPYVILPFCPGALRFLPRPGEWLTGFKQLLSFPMFATASWLIWILAKQVVVDDLMTFLFGLLPLSFGLWVYGRWAAPHRSLMTRRAGAIIAIVLIALTWRNSEPSAVANANIACDRPGQELKTDSKIPWEAFSKARLNTLIQNNHAVLVDFSAAWCLTCQANHKIALSSDKVAEELRSKGVVSLHGDWTSRDPEITQAINSYGRAGVPLTVLHIPGEAPVILPSVFTAGDLLSLLESKLPIQLAYNGKDIKQFSQ